MNNTHSKTVVRVESEEPTRRLALLIDADNAQAAVIEGLLEEVARFGEATVRRIYGDFTAPTSASWKKVLNKHSIKPVQQFAYTTGKNATDSTMVIDAMDLLYSRKFDGFCLVTSDSDFTGLAVRLREEGLHVFGFGEQKTPEAFRTACHRFVFTEVLRKPVETVVPTAQVNPANTPAVEPKPAPDGVQASLVKPVFPQEFLMEALEKTIDDSGWAHLGNFGSYVRKVRPDFDERLHGYKKLSDLVRSRAELFDSEERVSADGINKALYVRAKRVVQS